MKNFFFHADDFGRSRNISKSINILIKKKIITSVSIIVSEKIYGLDYLKKYNIHKRLHLNLTDFSNKKKSNKFIYNLSFLKLCFLPFLPNFDDNKKKLREEILRQINLYKKKINKKNIFIDGHQHVQMIPWIFNILYDLKTKHNITNMRIPNEKFKLNNLNILKFAICKNIIKLLLIKIFIFINRNKIKKIRYKYNFFGIIYSGVQSEKSLKNAILDYQNTKKSNKLEILIHPGYASLKEKKLFKSSFFKYYFSKNRKKEFKLIKSFN